MENQQPMVDIITIDGPSGTGKGTMALRLAQRLEWHLLDSGALYRVVAWFYQQHQYSAVESFLSALDDVPLDMSQVHFKPISTEVLVYYGAEDISTAIRSEACAKQASILAAEPKIRDYLFHCQHAFATTPGLVADGRDMGTVIFPQAKLKLFLTASAETRAKRRYHQLQQPAGGARAKEKSKTETGAEEKSTAESAAEAAVKSDLHNMQKRLLSRDMRDSSRRVARLQPAEDAIIIDTDQLDLQQVEERIWQHITSRGIR